MFLLLTWRHGNRASISSSQAVTWLGQRAIANGPAILSADEPSLPAKDFATAWE
jgi:hypothetical protein